MPYTGFVTKRPKVTDSELSIFMHDYQKARDAHQDQHRITTRNMAAYTNDLCSLQLRQALNHDNREVQNFNILHHIVRGHMGNILNNWFDPKWTAREGEPIDSVEALAMVHAAQKELYNYKRSACACIENGYVKVGVEGLVVDRPSPDPRTWGLKFVNYRPELVDFDPNVYSDNISRDSKQAWVTSYISPKTMLQTFSAANDDILSALAKQDDEGGRQFEAMNRDTFQDLDRPRIGSNYKTVEWMHIENERVKKQFLTDGSNIGAELPDTGFPIGSDEDVAHKIAWALQRGFVLTDDMIATVEHWNPVMYTTTFCPPLGILLENRKDYRQLNGHLPLYAFSFLQKGGMFFGLMDFGWDIQQDFNKRELAKTKIISKTPIGGKAWISRDAFEGNQGKLDEAVATFNDPGVPFVVPEGAGPIQNVVGIMQGMQIPPAVLQDESFKMGLADRVLMLPAALQGRSERQADSGVAIGRKVVEGQVMQRGETEAVIQHENDKAEDWTILGIKMFGHPSNRNRRFSMANTTRDITINEVVGFDPIGDPVVRNDISKLSRPRVTISQTKENDYMAQARREMAVGALQAMVPSETNILTRAGMEYSLATNMDFGSDEDKARVKELADIELETVRLRGLNMLKAEQSRHEQVTGGGQQQPGGDTGQVGAPGQSVGQDAEAQGGIPYERIPNPRPEMATA